MIQNYSDPIVTLNQVYKSSGTGTTPELGACIIGPNYYIRAYEDLAEKLRLDSKEIYPSGDYSTSYTPENGLGARPYPYITSADGDILADDTKVFVVDAKLNYITFGESDSYTLETDTGYDTIKIKEAETGDYHVFNGLGAGDTYVQTAAGDGVIITNATGSVTEKIECLVQGFLKDDNGHYTRCVLSKELPHTWTSGIKSIKFYRAVSAYLKDSSVTKTTVGLKAMVGVAPEAQIVADLGLGLTEYTVLNGAFYAEYRGISEAYVGKYGMLSSVDDVEDVLGKICPENPLAIAVACALRESQSNFVYFTAIDQAKVNSSALPSLSAAYAEAADLVADKDGIHGIVPCTADADVLQELYQFVTDQSAEEIPYFKFLYGSVDIPEEYLIKEDIKVTSSTLSSSNTKIVLEGSPLLVLQNIVKGDVVKWSGYTAKVLESNNKDTLTLEGDYTTTLTAGKYIAIYHTITSNADIVDTLVKNKGISNKRMAYVFADDAIYDGYNVPNYCVAAALAGKRSGVQPHAPLSNVELTAVYTSEAHGFTASQLKQLGAYGFWRVGMNESGVCISRRQLTSAAADDVNLDEQSIICDIDSICLSLKTVGRDMVGNSNISSALIQLLRASLNGKLNQYTIASNTYIGPQLITYSIDLLAQDEVNKDRIYATISGEPPKPFNKFNITFYIK